VDRRVASAVPLATVETDFAVDSSGFATCRFERWFEHKYGREASTRKWLKAHIMVGTRSNIVTGVEVTPGTAADSNYLPGLLKDTAANFHVVAVSADKGVFLDAQRRRHRGGRGSRTSRSERTLRRPMTARRGAACTTSSP
jgi:hypothetical protein